jgi:hypothetical protein
MSKLNLFLAVPIFLALGLVHPGAQAGSHAESETVTVTRSCSNSVRLNVNTTNGHTIVRFNGKKVFSGKTQGAVLANSEVRDCKAFAAVWDDMAVLWQNREDAATVLKKP